MAEVVVFDIDAASAIQKLAQLRADTNALKEAQKQLAVEVQKGNKDAATSYEANAIILKNLANEQRNLSRQVEGYAQVQKDATDITNFANNSIQQNRDLLKQLTAQYINLKNPSAEATKQLKQLSDTLKQQESSIGDTRRNVGNYAEALGGLASRIPGVSKATDALNKIQSASPVGRLVEIFFALVDALKGNAQVMDTITFLTAALNKAFQLLADRAVEIGKKIVEAFTNPKKFIEDLAFVLTNPIEAFRKLSNAALQTGKDLLQAGKDGFNASKSLDAFTVAQAEAQLATEKNRIEIEKFKKSLEDTTKSTKDRIAIAKEITRLSIENSKIEADIAKEALRIEKEKLKNKELTAEEQAKLLELEKNLFIAQNKFQIEVAEQEKKINELTQKQITDNLKKELKERKDAIVDFQKQANDNQKKFIEEFLTGVEKELELLDLQQEGRRDFLIQSGLTEAEITEKFRKERLDVIDEFAQKEIDANLKVAEENLRIQEEYNEKQRELAFALAEAEREITFQRIDIASQAANLLSGIVGEQSVISNLALIVQKSAAIADIIVQTQAANAAARANVSLYPPFVPNPLGLPIPSPAFVKALVLSQAQVTRNNIQAGIAVATIGAQTIQQVAPKFAEGGEISIDGKSHAQGGEIVTVGGRPVAEVEGGEGLYVMKKNAYQAIKQFSAINEAFGGKSWLKGSSKYLADGGAINATLPAMESRNRVNSTLEQNRLLAQAIKQIPAPVLSIKEFETKQAIKDKSVRVSEL